MEPVTDAVAFEPIEFPAWVRWGQRAGAKLDGVRLAAHFPDARHWRPLVGYVGNVRRCRWCATIIPAGRRSWCSEQCVDKFRRVWSWGALAEYVRDRDGRRCRHCRTDFPGWNRSRALTKITFVSPVRDWATPRAVILEHGYRMEAHALAEWWEIDHVLPVMDGGTDHPANLRLLCHACHVERGRRWRGMLDQQPRPR